MFKDRIAHIQLADNQQPNASLIETPRRKAKIVNDGLTHAVRIDALRRETDEAVHLRAAERLRVVNRKANAVLELAYPIGQTGDAPLAGVPVPGGQVMEHLGQPVLMKRVRKLLLPERVREHELDAVEAVGSRAAAKRSTKPCSL